MEDTIREMCERHFNEPIICESEVVRLIGYGQTARDCYLICSRMRSQGGYSAVFWHTAVGGYMFLDLLKDQGRVTSTEGKKWNDFTRIDSLLALNGAPRVDDFILKIDLDDNENEYDCYNAAED